MMAHDPLCFGRLVLLPANDNPFRQGPPPQRGHGFNDGGVSGGLAGPILNLEEG
jgi:hypothetical protein